MLEFNKMLKSLYRKQDKIAPLIEGLEDAIPPQSLDDYYVKLKTIIKSDNDKEYLNYERIAGKKQEIDIEALFDLPENASPASVHRLLIVGGAGVGKSTLMQYIAYRWSNGELWNDKFDYVYRVPLKKLLNRGDWDHNYGRQEEDSPDILKCLIYEHLIAEERGFCRLEELPWTRDRTLLLLDGYDEVAHERKGIYKRIFEDIFDHRNIILTSRPNAIDKEIAEKFGRRIENIGFDHDGINQYLTRYFKGNRSKGLALEEYLEKNFSLKDICRIPVNITMVCFIWAGGDSNEAFHGISSLSDLYHQVVDQLGFRYYAKQQCNLRSCYQDIWSKWNGERVYLDELHVLQHTAYKAMTGGGIKVPEDKRLETLIIRGMTKKGDTEGISIQSSINYLSSELKKEMPTINKVYKYGLLKPEGVFGTFKKEHSETDLQAQSFSFIHLSFQEFLTAQYFAEKLMGENNHELKTNIANFIAQHRNEPRYLMTLKFMAGIFCNEEGEQAENGSMIFWDAVMCNADGVLELGVETKVSLLMHLLSQVARINERIPNWRVAVRLIDCVVLRDLSRWSAQLRESDYISDNIREGLIEYFVNGNVGWLAKKSLELQRMINPGLVEIDNIEPSMEDVIGIISGMIGKFSKEQQYRMFLKALEVLKNYTEIKWQCAKKVIEFIIVILKKTGLEIERDKQKELLKALLVKADDCNFIEVCCSAVRELLNNPESMVLIFESLQEKLEAEDRKIDVVMEVMKYCDLTCNNDFNRQIIDKLAKLSQDSNREVVIATSKNIIELARIGDSRLGSYAVKSLLPLLKDSKWDVKVVVSETILEVLKLNSHETGNDIYGLVFDAFILLSQKPQHNTKMLGLNRIQKLVMMIGRDDTGTAHHAIQNLESLLEDSNQDEKIAIIKKILELTKIDGQDIENIMKIFPQLLKGSDVKMKQFAMKNITKLTRGDENDANTQIALVILQSLEESLQNSDLKFSALKRISELVKRYNSLLPDALKALRNLLKDSEPNEVQISASKNLIELIKLSDDEIDNQLFEDLRATLTRLLQDVNPDISTAASKSLIKLLKIHGNKKFIESVIKGVIPLLEDFDEYVRKVALEGIIKSINVRKVASDSLKQAIKLSNSGENRIQFAKFTLDEVLKYWRDPVIDGRKRALNIVPELVKITGKSDLVVVEEIIYTLKQFLYDKNCGIRISASNCITEVVKGQPDPVVRDAIDIFKPILKDSHTTVRKAISKNIIKLLVESSRGDPQLSDEILKSLFEYSRESDWNVKISISDITMGFLKIGGESDAQLIEDMLRNLTSILKRSKQCARKAASGSIIEVLEEKGARDIELVQRVSETLLPLLSDKNWYVRKAASENLLKLMNLNSENRFSIDIIMILAPLLESADVYVRQIASYNIAELVKGRNSNYEALLGGILNTLSPFLRDSNQFVRILASNKIIELVQRSDNFTLKNVAQEIFHALLYDSNWEAQNLAANSLLELMKITGYKDARLIEEIIDILAGILKDPQTNLDVKISASKKMTEFIKVIIHDGDLVKCVLAELALFLKSSERDLQKSSSDNIIEIMEKSGISDTKLTAKVFNALIPFLEDPSPNLRTTASKNLIRLAMIENSNHSICTKYTLKLLIPHFRDYDKKISTALVELFKVKRRLDDQLLHYVIANLAPLLQDSRAEKMSSAIIKSVFLMELEYPDRLAQYFNHPSKNLRDVLSESLLDRLKDYVQRFQALDELFQDPKSLLTLENISNKLFPMTEKLKTDIENLQRNEAFSELKFLLFSKINHIEALTGPSLIELAMVIIGKEKASDHQELRELAKEILNIQVNYLNDDGLTWINNNHDKLLSLSPEAKSFYRKVCHKMLEDEVITPLEESLMIKFINHGLTNSLTRDGEVIFEGKRYKLRGNDIDQALEKIAKTIIGQQQDILAAQYQNHEPIFLRSDIQGGMTEAAADQKEVKSIVDSRFRLKNDRWLLTRLRSLKFKSEILILEKRCAFGDHCISHLTVCKQFRFYPKKYSELREIFGSYVYREAYQGEVKELTDELGRKCFESESEGKLNFDKIEGKSLGKRIYFQQELLQEGYEDRNEAHEEDLAMKLDDNNKALEVKLGSLDLLDSQKHSIKEYYEGFVSTFSTVYTSSQAIADGKVAIDVGMEFFSLLNLFRQLTCIATFKYGDVIGFGLDRLKEYIIETETRNKARYIKDIARDAVELSDLACKTALDIISKKKSVRRILEARDDDEANNWLDKIKQFILKQFEGLKNKVKNFKKLRNLFLEQIERTPAFKLGVNDAKEVIGKWIRWYEKRGEKMSFKEKQKKFVRIVKKKNKEFGLKKARQQCDFSNDKKDETCGIF